MKKKTTQIATLLCLIIPLLILSCNESKKKENDQKDKPEKKELKFGDKHEGGYIIYLDKTKEHGLVCAKENISSNAEWGCPGVIIGTKEEENTGAENTKKIVSICDDAESAASICEKYTFDGYSDWYLPSIQELRMMYSLHIEGKGDFKQIGYWSSSECDANSAYLLNFMGGSYGNYDKSNIGYVRCVRSF